MRNKILGRDAPLNVPVNRLEKPIQWNKPLKILVGTNLISFKYQAVQYQPQHFLKVVTGKDDQMLKIMEVQARWERAHTKTTFCDQKLHFQSFQI